MGSAAEKKSFWRTHYDCSTYERDIGSYAQAVDRSVVEAWLAGKTGLLLDIPCGTGRFARVASELTYTVVGADISLQMLASNESKMLVQADAFRMPFRDASFDLVLAMRLLFHYPKPEQILSEIHRTLLPGSTTVFDTLNTLSLRHLLQMFPSLFKPKSASLWFCSRRRFHKILGHIGFEVIEVKSRYVLPTRSYRFLPLPLVWLFDKIEFFWPARVVSFWYCKKI